MITTIVCKMASDMSDQLSMDSWDIDLDATDSELSQCGEESAGAELSHILSHILAEHLTSADSSSTTVSSSPSGESAMEQPDSRGGESKAQVSAKPVTRRKKSYYRPVNPFKQIIRIDLRRRLPLMYVNVSNSHNPELYGRFWAQFSSKDCSYSATYPNAAKPVFPIAYGSTSFQQLIAHNAYRCATCPDTVIRMQYCYFRRSKEFSGTEIVSLGYGVGIKLFELEVPPTGIPLSLKELIPLRVKAKQAYEVTHWILTRVLVDENNVIVSMAFECLSSSYVPVPWPSGV